MDRGRLDIFRTKSLAGSEVIISRAGEALRYRLLDQLGPGKTAVAWKVLDSNQREFAIKFTLREDYHTHSLDAEIDRANKLSSPLVAKIIFMGVPKFIDIDKEENDFYAIVVEWVEGPTLRDYLEANRNDISAEIFLQFSRDLCEVLNVLRYQNLMHNDLHDKNIIVSPRRDHLTGEVTYQLVVIDTGQLKTEEKRRDLIEKWEDKIRTLESLERDVCDAVSEKMKQLKEWIDYFSRTDQEWITFHFCSLYNAMKTAGSGQPRTLKFLDELPEILRLTIDPDPSRRIDDPVEIYRAIESRWHASNMRDSAGMQTPFDLPSAELIRSDRQLMDLLAEEYPRLDECRSNSPVYIYGPRGCGKSTILRSLSIKAIIDSKSPESEIAKVQFTGIYISCSSELRSRFWLMPVEDYEDLQTSIIKYFNLLFLEELVDTFDRLLQWDEQPSSHALKFGMTEDLALQCCTAIRTRLELTDNPPRYYRTSQFGHLRGQMRQQRDGVWRSILRRERPSDLPNPQLIFDVSKDLERTCQFLQQRRLAFLLDDYSNQRIPKELQRKLNQSITFAKQGAPIFKVSSEYDGVDLEGIQEGREVREVNVGFEYVSLQAEQRWKFFKSLLQRRFDYLESPVDILKVLPLSGMQPAIGMAKAIKEAVTSKKKFYYHGLDTISDLCSGDFAMGLDLVRKIFENGNINWKSPTEVKPKDQDVSIHEYASREFEYIRYRSEKGLLKYEIVERLCWLAHKCVLDKIRRKDGELVPLVKNHLDITETALRDLQKYSNDHYILLEEMIRKGILFPLQTSKSRELHRGTKRYMVRRILLARYDAPLGRDVAIRIDDLERLRTLLTDPMQFVNTEFARTNPERTSDSGESQRQFDF
jgi:serine/threonine protein kinase